MQAPGRVGHTNIPWGVHHNDVKKPPIPMLLLSLDKPVKVKGKDVGRNWNAVLLVFVESRYWTKNSFLFNCY